MAKNEAKPLSYCRSGSQFESATTPTWHTLHTAAHIQHPFDYGGVLKTSEPCCHILLLSATAVEVQKKKNPLHYRPVCLLWRRTRYDC